MPRPSANKKRKLQQKKSKNKKAQRTWYDSDEDCALEEGEARTQEAVQRRPRAATTTNHDDETIRRGNLRVTTSSSLKRHQNPSTDAYATLLSLLRVPNESHGNRREDDPSQEEASSDDEDERASSMEPDEPEQNDDDDEEEAEAEAEEEMTQDLPPDETEFKNALKIRNSFADSFEEKQAIWESVGKPIKLGTIRDADGDSNTSATRSVGAAHDVEAGGDLTMFLSDAHPSLIGTEANGGDDDVVFRPIAERLFADEVWSPSTIIKPRVWERWKRYVNAFNAYAEHRARAVSRIGGASNVRGGKEEYAAFFSPSQAAMFPHVFLEQRDVYHTARGLENAVQLREMYVLHALNRALAARDEVERHDVASRRENSSHVGGGGRRRSEQDAGHANEEDPPRDQGFSRASVLIILPYRNSAFRVVKLLLELLPEGVEVDNYDRFLEEFGPAGEDTEEDAAVAAPIREAPSSHSPNELEFAREIHPSQAYRLSKTTTTTAGSEDDDDEDEAKGDDDDDTNVRKNKKKKKRSPPRRPADWHAAFFGNRDENFRIGIRFRGRKAVRLFAGFLDADIIIASPLGLRLATRIPLDVASTPHIGNADPEEDEIVRAAAITREEEEKPKDNDDDDLANERGNEEGNRRGKSEKDAVDFDFLSSVELVVVDEADAFLMQNFQHLVDVCTVVGRRPRRGVHAELDRVAQRFLSGNASLFRQTLVFSAFSDRALNALVNHGAVAGAGLCRNWFGRLTLRRLSRAGAAALLPPGVPQRFVFAGREESRLEFFRKRLLPSLVDAAKTSGGVLVFVPSYLDFVQVRRLLRETLGDAAAGAKEEEEEEEESRGFACVSEYTSPPEVARARGAFYSRHIGVLVLTERFHYYNRYRIEGVRKTVFFAPPKHAVFYREFTPRSQRGDVRVLFAEEDAIELDRIVGTRAMREWGLVRGNDLELGKTFSLVVEE